MCTTTCGGLEAFGGVSSSFVVVGCFLSFTVAGAGAGGGSEAFALVLDCKDGGS